MQYWSKSLLLLAIAGLFALGGCSKPSDLGLSLVEQNPIDIFYTDTISLQMTSVATDPLRTEARSRWLCGAYVDPVFGKTEAGIYTNFRLVSTNATFPNATLDSVVLTLEYDSLGHYGNNLTSLTAQTWEVYRLTEGIISEQDYLSNQTFATSTLLGTSNFIPNLEDSVEIQGENLNPHLRIRLDDALGQELMNPTVDAYTSNITFKEFFKGVYIRPVSTANNTAILRFAPLGTQSKLTLYYKDSANVARSLDYLTDNDAESVLNLTHDYSGTTVLNNNVIDTTVYVQGMNGVSARITLPHIANLGKIIVNKAELIVYTVGAEDPIYPIPDQLFALERESTGDFLLVDDIITSIERNTSNPFLQFGGILETDGSVRFFRMNLSQFMQRFVDNEIDENALYIQPASVTDTERMLLGNERANLKAKLFITYTKIN